MDTGYYDFREVATHAVRRAFATAVQNKGARLWPCPHRPRLVALWLWLVYWHQIRSGGVCCGSFEPSPLPFVSVANAQATTAAPLPDGVRQWPEVALALCASAVACGVVLVTCALIAETAGRRVLWLLRAHAAARRLCYQCTSCKHNALARRRAAVACTRCPLRGAPPPWGGACSSPSGEGLSFP